MLNVFMIEEKKKKIFTA